MNDGYEFIVDAKKFYNANNMMYKVKNHLNECRNILSGDVYEQIEETVAFSESVEKCFNHAKKIIEKIEQAKESLFSFTEFLGEYAIASESQKDLLISQDASGMLKDCSEEEKQNYLREYYLTKLKECENEKRKGMFTSKEEKEYEFYKLNLEYIEYNKKLSEFMQINDEYLELFEKVGEKRTDILKLNYYGISQELLDLQLKEEEKKFLVQKEIVKAQIEINKNLEYQKKFDEEIYPWNYHHYNLEIIKQQRIIYNQIEKIRELTQEEKQKLEELNKVEEYERLLCDSAAIKNRFKGVAGSFMQSQFNKEILEFRVKNDMATRDEIIWYNSGALEKFGNYTLVAANSIFTRMYRAGNNIEKGAQMVLIFPAELSNIFFDNSKYLDSINATIAEDYATKLYDKAVKSGGLNSYIAYGGVHSYSCLVGDVVSTISLWEIPYAWEVSAVGSFGDYSQRGLQNGDNYFKTFFKSAPKAYLEYLTTQRLLKLNAYSGANTDSYFTLFKNATYASGTAVLGGYAICVNDFMWSGEKDFGVYFLENDGVRKLGTKAVSAFISNSSSGLKCINYRKRLEELEIRKKYIIDNAYKDAKMKYELKFGEGSFAKCTETKKVRLQNEYIIDELKKYEEEISEVQKMMYWAMYGDIRKSYKKMDFSKQNIIIYSNDTKNFKTIVVKSAKSNITGFSYDGLDYKFKNNYDFLFNNNNIMQKITKLR